MERVDVRARSLQFVEPRTVRVDSHDVPVPGDDEVLIESRASLVSAGTELMIYRGEAPDGLAADESIGPLTGDLSFPLKYGYAVVGDVVGLGEDVPPPWRDRRVFAFNPHESHFTAGIDELISIPAGTSTETATFLPIAETAINLVLDGAPRVGERVVVFGAGLVGLFTLSTLARFPLGNLTVVEPVSGRRALARRFGADEVVAPGTADGRAGEADVVFELSGSPEALDDAIALAGYGGRVVVGSWYGRKRADLDLGGRFHRDRISLVSSQVSTVSPELRGRWDKDRRIDVAWRHLDSVSVDDFVTHRIPITEAPRAYELLDSDPEDALGVLLTYR